MCATLLVRRLEAGEIKHGTGYSNVPSQSGKKDYHVARKFLNVFFFFGSGNFVILANGKHPGPGCSKAG